jgi:hypothetical protein
MAVFWDAAPLRYCPAFQWSLLPPSCQYLPDYTAQHPRRQPSSYSSPWEPETSPVCIPCFTPPLDRPKAYFLSLQSNGLSSHHFLRRVFNSKLQKALISSLNFTTTKTEWLATVFHRSKSAALCVWFPTNVAIPGLCRTNMGYVSKLSGSGAGGGWGGGFKTAVAGKPWTSFCVSTT